VNARNESLPIRIQFVSLGCAKNLVDSEKMMGLLAEAGCTFVSPDAQADLTIINTCGFIEEARQEARQTIRQALEDKNSGTTGRIVVTGCLAQLWAGKLLEEFPDIDALLGLADRSQIAQIAADLVQGTPAKAKKIKANTIIKPFHTGVHEDQARLRLTDPSWAYLRISEGCGMGCTFCTIPAIRGPFRSKPLDRILAEAAELVRDGAVELNLIGQETSGYGSDLGLVSGFSELLKQLNQLDPLRWIRILYAHPATLTDAHIETMAACQKVVPYIDIPLQHINDRILKLMHRRINRKQTEEIIRKLRHTIPEITIRTTLLVGFPSEKDSEFEELLDFVVENRFEALGCFTYSPEEGTAAARIKNHVPQEIKQQRLDTIMTAQQQIAFDHARHQVGKNPDCLITSFLEPPAVRDLKLDRKKTWYNARHRGQAPEMDGVCYLAGEKADKDLIGTIRPAAISGHMDYDLIGSV